MDWKSLLARENITVKEALKKMDAGAQRILFIVNKEGVLRGVITDGDIRRHILSEGKLTDSIAQVYNPHPVSFPEHYSQKALKKTMIDNRIEVIPLINEKKQIVDTVCWTDIFTNKETISKNQIGIPVVIMAGGKGDRLDPFTRILPKPLIPIGEKPIIELIIDSFRSVGVQDFYVTLNYKGEMVKTFFDSFDKKYRITYTWEREALGTAGSLRLLPPTIADTFLISNCDIIVHADYSDLLAFHIRNKNILTVVGSIQHHRIPYGIIHFKNKGKIKNIQEKPEFDFTVNTGVYLASKRILEVIPPESNFDMTDLINRLLKKKENVGIYPVSQKSYIDIGQWEDYKKTIERFNIL